MTIQDILNTTDHRPWENPKGKWKYYQEWNNAIFLHWQVDIDELKKHVPNELEIDLFDGNPWVSVVAFSMEKIRLRNLPAFPPISDFDEINNRTYIKANNKSGVYFLSIEGGKILSCKIAKGISGLPYRFSKIKRPENQYESYNSEFSDKLKIDFTIGNEINSKTDLDIWLTERYAVFQDYRQSINEFEFHHLEWALKEIEVTSLDYGYHRFGDLILDSPHKIHYSNGNKVIAWKKNKMLRLSRRS